MEELKNDLEKIPFQLFLFKVIYNNRINIYEKFIKYYSYELLLFLDASRIILCL